MEDFFIHLHVNGRIYQKKKKKKVFDIEFLIVWSFSLSYTINGIVKQFRINPLSDTETFIKTFNM